MIFWRLEGLPVPVLQRGYGYHRLRFIPASVQTSVRFGGSTFRLRAAARASEKYPNWGALRKEGALMIYIWFVFGLWCHHPSSLYLWT